MRQVRPPRMRLSPEPPHAPESGPAMGDAIASGGRPESETDTPANTGNGPYRDNGEGVAATPLP